MNFQCPTGFLKGTGNTYIKSFMPSGWKATRKKLFLNSN